jgi:aspartate aminotransferase/aminotransferase
MSPVRFETQDAPSMRLSAAIERIPEALSIYFNELVYDLKRAGEDVVVLSLGEAFFDIPLFDFHKLDVSKSYHYSDSRGIPELRTKIADYYQHHYGAPVNADTELLISAGSKPLIYMALVCVLDPGDEILMHEPAWLSYQEHARLIGATPKFIPYDSPVEKFGDYFTPKTRALIINNPNNPAGRLYSRMDLEGIYEACRSRGIFLMIDEAYSDFVLDEEFVSLAEVVPDKDGIIIVNSLSKNMGMSGWRIGYLISNPAFVDAVLKMNQHIITCAPTILLYYCATYFDQIIGITLPQVREVVSKRARVAEMMDQLSLQRLGGGTTFYFFVDIGSFPGTSEEFAEKLLFERSIAVVPGSAYGTSTDRFIRVSIGSESEERIWDALQVIQAQTRLRELDREALRQKIDERIAQFRIGR